MINKEEIQSAANDYSKILQIDEVEAKSLKIGFIEGVEWAIKKHLNHVTLVSKNNNSPLILKTNYEISEENKQLLADTLQEMKAAPFIIIPEDAQIMELQPSQALLASVANLLNGISNGDVTVFSESNFDYIQHLENTYKELIQ